MSDPVTPRRSLTVDDYLRFEESSQVRHEFVAGEVYAMTGATRRHNRIVTNIVMCLGNAALGGPCEVFASDMKVHAADDVIYYPDVVVACTPGDDDAVAVRDPSLIAEVTSPKTASTDRREKLATYRRIDSLRAYLIVDNRRRRVERHWRDYAGDWWREELIGDGALPVPCPETALSLDEIYRGVQLAALSEPEPEEYEV